MDNLIRSLQEKRSVELIETHYLKDETAKEYKKIFSSKGALVSLLKKSALSTKTIYNLTKNNEAHIMKDGIEVKLEIRDVK